MITIIDYGMGNLGSIANMIKKIGYSCNIASNKDIISHASKLILPGVGHFHKAMDNIIELELTDTIRHLVLHKKVPVLGICLGMQLMTRYSGEGNRDGLGLIDARVKKFALLKADGFRIPHMGWNSVEINKPSKLFNNVKDEQRFYFVHSYHVECENESDILTETQYGYKFASAFETNNILGVQFHPEKSHKFGLNLLKNFIENY